MVSPKQHSLAAQAARQGASHRPVCFESLRPCDHVADKTKFLWTIGHSIEVQFTQIISCVMLES